MKILLILAALLVPMQAHAGLFEAVFQVGLIIASGMTGIPFYLAIGLTAYGAYKSEELRRQQEGQANRQRDAYNASLKDRTITSVSTEAPFMYVYGRARVGSAVVAILPSGGRDEYQHIVAIHAAHECDGFEEIYIAGKALGTLDSDGFAINSPDYAKTIITSQDNSGASWSINASYVAGSITVDQLIDIPNEPTSVISTSFTQVGNVITVAASGYYRTNYSYKASTVRVKKHLGTAGEAADATLISECPTKWTFNSKLSGFCYTYIRLDLNQQEFQGGLPAIEVVLRGKILYDPRENLLKYSEQFSNAAWSDKTAVTATDNTTVAPDGTNTAATLARSGVSGAWCDFGQPRTVGAGGNVGKSYTFSVWAWVDSGTLAATLGISDRSYNSYYTSVTLTTTPTLFTFTSSGGSGWSAFGSQIAAGLGWSTVSSIHVWHPQFNEGVTTLPYTTTSSDAKIPGTTWAQNNALVLYDYLRSDFCGVPTGDIPVADIITAANVCDEVITIDSASVPRYTFNGTITSEQSQPGVITQIAQSMAGGINSTTWEMWAGKYVAPTLTLQQEDIVGALSITPGLSDAEIYNGVTGRFIGAENGYAATDIQPYQNAAYRAADGRDLFASMEFPFTDQTQRCHNLARIYVEDQRNSFTVKAVFSLKAWDTKIGQRVYLNAAFLGFSNKIFRVVGKTYNYNTSVDLLLKEDAASIWDLADAVTLTSTPSSGLPNPFNLNAPTSLTLTSGTTELLTQSDGTVVSRIKAAWPTDGNIYAAQAEIQYKVYNATDWQTAAIVDATLGVTHIAPVNDGETYDTRIRFINPYLTTQSLWKNGAMHTVVGKTAAPDPFDVFSIMAQPDGTRQYNFKYTTTAKPADWLGAEIRYVAGTTGSPDWATMTLLQDATTYYTNSPVELNAPLAGTYTFACKSLDTSLNESTYKVVNITLPDRRLGNVFDEFFEAAEGWTGTKTGCHVQDSYLEADDSTTWATLPATWAGWTRWNYAPTSPITYVTPIRDFGTVVAGQVNTVVDADGTVVQELATSNDGSTWSAWVSASTAFSCRYIKLRLTVTATGPAPVPLVRQFDYQINAAIKSEYINDVVISGLTGSYRIGTGDIRIPLAGTYSFLKRISITIQDSTAGTWTWARIDQTLTYGPRIQFRLNGTLTDPAYVDFFIEGY